MQAMARPKKTEGGGEDSKSIRIEIRVSPGMYEDALNLAKIENVAPATFHRRCWEKGLNIEAQQSLMRQNAIASLQAQRSQVKEEESTNGESRTTAEDIHE